MKCIECRWFSKALTLETESVPDGGVCKRYPPTLNVIQLMKFIESYKQQEFGGGIGEIFFWMHPVTFHENYCGEFDHKMRDSA